MAQTNSNLELSEKDKGQHNLALIEAALYVSGRPLEWKTLGSLIKTRSKSKVYKLARALMTEYSKRNTALEILEVENERFVLQLKPRFTPKVRKLAIRPLISVGPLKTLSYIAYRQPVLQRHVIDVRGSHAYGHLRQLEELGLISREKVRRSMLLRTTEFFADYFGLSHETRTMKRQLKKAFGKISEEDPQKKR